MALVCTDDPSVHALVADACTINEKQTGEQHAHMQVLDKHTMLSKQILHPTSGMVVPGELMALVGPSGAGGRLTLWDARAFCHSCWNLSLAVMERR